MNQNQQRVGEIIEVSNSTFSAQCIEPDELKFPHLPAFGSFVKAEDEETGNIILAVIYQSGTNTFDSVHRVRALGMTIAEIREQQPQIFALTSTMFKAAIIGYILPDGKSYRQYLPPRPPQVHQGIFKVASQEIAWFTTEFDFLSTLLGVLDAPVDALVAAVIREAYQSRSCDSFWLVKAGRKLNLLLRDDYDRLKLILSQFRGN